MSDVNLFRISEDAVNELEGTSVAVEKSLQALIEKNLETLLGVKFLASEHNTGKTHKGRIDSLGVDENGGPVIIEYKRSVNQNVINQGLYYLDWLLDHKAEFQLLVLKKLGEDAAKEIEWGTPRLLCIAGDFTKYDEHAVQQIDRNIELIRYRKYGDELLLLELVNVTTAQTELMTTKPKGTYKTVTEFLNQADDDLRDRFESLKAFLLTLGDDVQMKTLKYYFAFKRIKNFACVEIHPQNRTILMFVKLNPDNISMERGFTRDVRKIGHYGTGDVEITIKSDADFEKAKPLLVQSYDAS